jgi:hypothetical protein
VTDDAFTAEWLGLREQADHRSRATVLGDLLEDAGAARGWSHVLDLGTGTGSNMRYLRPRLPWARIWTLVDHDADLLAKAQLASDEHRVCAIQGDLATEGISAVAHADLVTASALLDLVSEEWLQQLVDACSTRGCGALFALSYDGTVSWSDALPDDALITDALNRHQRRDKGVGSALGPVAATVAAELFARAGYRTWLEAAPWELRGIRDRDLTLALMTGWTTAAVEVLPDEQRRIDVWAAARTDAVATGQYQVRVGHFDLLALPATGGPDGSGSR